MTGCIIGDFTGEIPDRTQSNSLFVFSKNLRKLVDFLVLDFLYIFDIF